MTRATPRFIMVKNEEDIDITSWVRECKITRGAELQRNPTRALAGSTGTIVLDNGEDEWTPRRSRSHSAAFLIRPIPFRVELVSDAGWEQVWFTGLLRIAGGPKRTARGTLSTRLSDIRDTKAVTIESEDGDSLAHYFEEGVADAIDVPVTFTASAEERALTIAGGERTDRGGFLLNKIHDALPSLVYEDVPGNFQVRTLSDIERTARIDRIFSTSQYHMTTDFDIGPDAKRVVNQYLIFNNDGEAETYSDPVTFPTWGVREYESSFDLWETVPDKNFFVPGLETYADAPAIAHVRFPLDQPSPDALGGVIGRPVTPVLENITLDGEPLTLDGENITISVLTGEGHNGIEAGGLYTVVLSTQVLRRAQCRAVRLNYKFDKLPFIEMQALAVNYNPIAFTLGWTPPGKVGPAPALGSNSILGPTNRNAINYWVLGHSTYSVLGSTTRLNF